MRQKTNTKEKARIVLANERRALNIEFEEKKQDIIKEYSSYMKRMREKRDKEREMEIKKINSRWKSRIEFLKAEQARAIKQYRNRMNILYKGKCGKVVLHPIEECKFNALFVNALKSINVKYLEEFTAMAAADVYWLHGCGRKTIKKIETHMKKYGLSFADVEDK